MILRIIALALLTSTAYAHGGKTNAEGCHTEKKTGVYHCHNGASKPTVPTNPVNTTVTAPTPPLATDTKPATSIMKLDYEGFTVWLDCSKRGAVKFQYVAQHDTGNAKRSDSFYLDPNVPPECQQTSAKPYGDKYDRGHQVPANHLDSSATAIKQTNFMTNILPQAANMNRGAWLATEELIECYRDIAELLVVGGVIWGNNPSDDYFIKSHGVATPDAFWKVVIRGTGQDERAIAWIVPNSQDAKRANLDSYLVTVDDIEKQTGEKLPVADYAKHDKPSESWIIPKGCNKG
jgi:endonuclease G